MRKFILIIVTIFCCSALKAQEGYKYIYGVGGISYPRSYNTKIGLEFPDKNNANAWDLGIILNFDPDDKREYFNYYALNLGFKPCLSKGINNMLRMNFNCSAGTDLKKFVLAPAIGIEYVQTIAFGVDLLIGTEGYYYFWANTKNWRIFGNIGLRIRI